MSISEHEKLTIDEFFEAISGRDGRYELVGGVVHAIPGARQGHNVIRSNVLTAFLPAGKRKGCRATSVNTGVQTGPATIRYPDVVVDCGPPDAAAMKASKPTIIVEISSPGTPVADYGVKLREYQSVDSIDTVMQIESETAMVKVHRRQQDGTWTEETVKEFDVSILPPSLAASITMNEIYDTLLR
jgi:Uma2 family endonuclease